MYRILLLVFLPFILLGQQHLLISEVFVPPSGETQKAFIEIANVSNQDVSLDSVYLANYNTYYQLVEDQFPSTNQFFVAQFPAGAVLPAGKVLVVAFDGQGFFNAFGKHADFQLNSTDAQSTDMLVVRSGNNIGLETLKGMVVLFAWDGVSDLVKDIDYLPWGLLAFNSAWMDKSGVQIDGPDADNQASAYKDDLAKAQQDAISSIPSGQSLQRTSEEEIGEVSSGGNGINGHNEATETFKQSFKTAAPRPGSFSLNAGDGTGLAVVDPDTVQTSETFDLTLTISTQDTFTLTQLRVVVPEAFQWSQQAGDVQLQGAGLNSANFTVNQNTIAIDNAQLNSQQNAVIVVKNLTAPAEEGSYVVQVETAVQGGQLTPIAVFPSITVQKTLTIADIQDNQDVFEGQTVTIEAVVTIGIGVLRTDRCDVYVQDESGRGINLNDASTDYPLLKRGNRLRITGRVTNYTSATTGDVTTEIVDFSLQLISTDNEVPAVPYLTCAEANNIDLEGTFIETAGVITDKAENIGGGTNITIEDASGALQLRIWDSSGLDLSAFSVGDTIQVRGVIDSYRKAAQVVVGYQQDIQKGAIPQTVAGSGTVTVSPDSVGRAQTVSLQFVLKAALSDPIGQFAIQIPQDWQWTASLADVETAAGFAGANVSASGNSILVTGFSIASGDSGILTINNLQSPDRDTTSIFVAKTAPAQGTLKPVSSSPVVMVGKGTGITYMSIEQARQQPVGSNITVKGVVTIGAGILRTNFTDAYLQDESGFGLNIYQGGTLDKRLKRGRLVILKGQLDEYQGKKEIVNYTLTILRDDVEIPAVRKLSTYQASTLDFEGSFVQIQGIITRKQWSGGGTNISVNDGSGEVTVRVWDTSNLNLDGFEPGDYVQVRGVVGVYRSAGQILLGYQEDITHPPLPEAEVYLKVPAKPFVPGLGEKLPIEYQASGGESHVTLRLFDLAGRLVTTLYDGDGLPFPVKKEWDGRDQLGELVPLGTYLCHLEVVSNANGKRVVKIAPVVVGTVLK